VAGPEAAVLSLLRVEEVATHPVECSFSSSVFPPADRGEDAAGGVASAAADRGVLATARVAIAAADRGKIAVGPVEPPPADRGVEEAGRVSTTWL
jgi:hypothetical protein